MTRKLLSAALCAMFIVTFGSATAPALPAHTKVQTYKSGLDFPIDMAWVPGTRTIFFTEKNTGRVRVMKGRKLRHRPCVDLPVSSDGERGALGIALHPKFKKNHYLYVYYTNAKPLQNRVARFKVVHNRCRHRKIIVKIPGPSSIHNGGQIEFVGNKLFVSVGEAGDPANAQNLRDKRGKILRVSARGSIPAGNPFRGAVWSYGVRNPFGLAHKPGTKKLFETENGPECNDELNRIKKGRNYGWGPSESCPNTNNSGPNPKAPLRRWSSIIVPTDLTWYRGRLNALHGLLMADYGRGRIHRFVMNSQGNRVRHDRIVYDSGSNIVDVSTGPGRWLYFLTGGSIMRIARR